MQKRERLVIEIFPILCEPSAPPEPCECSFHDPSFWQDDKAFGAIRARDDFDIHLRHYFCHGAAKQWALIWPAPGGVLMEPEVRHGEAEVHAGVQA